MLTANETPFATLTTTINTPATPISTTTNTTHFQLKLSKKELEAYIKNDIKTIDYTVVAANLFECSAYVVKSFFGWKDEDLVFSQCKDGITNMCESLLF